MTVVSIPTIRGESTPGGVPETLESDTKRCVKRTRALLKADGDYELHWPNLPKTEDPAKLGPAAMRLSVRGRQVVIDFPPDNPFRKSGRWWGLSTVWAVLGLLLLVSSIGSAAMVSAGQAAVGVCLFATALAFIVAILLCLRVARTAKSRLEFNRDHLVESKVGLLGKRVSRFLREEIRLVRYVVRPGTDLVSPSSVFQLVLEDKVHELVADRCEDDLVALGVVFEEILGLTGTSSWFPIEQNTRNFVAPRGSRICVEQGGESEVTIRFRSRVWIHAISEMATVGISLISLMLGIIGGVAAKIDFHAGSLIVVSAVGLAALAGASQMLVKGLVRSPIRIVISGGELSIRKPFRLLSRSNSWSAEEIRNLRVEYVEDNGSGITNAREDVSESLQKYWHLRMDVRGEPVDLLHRTDLYYVSHYELYWLAEVIDQALRKTR